MKLRPRQKTFVERTTSALNKNNNTLGVAPTGAGKTVMMAATLKEQDGKHLVLQHRDELVRQNAKTFKIINPSRSQSFVNANLKDPTGDTVFAMVQTLVRNLERLPEVDVLTVDEAHHAPATTYRKIIDAAYERNPNLKLLGVTATPVRGDKHGLRTVFDNVSDQITITELVKSGHLVKPRCFGVDLGVGEQIITAKRRGDGEYDPDAVAEIMDKRVHNERIVEEWAARAGNRQTVVFAATVDHAEHLSELWNERGYKAAIIHGEMQSYQRAQILEAYDKGEIQVLTNVMVLTEGWDHQPTSCIVLTRPLSFKGTMLQMIGRGLRKVDPDRYPGVRKDDCIVLDFGATLLAHGDLETSATIDTEEIIKCPECAANVPKGVRECPLCGFELFEKQEGGESDGGIWTPDEKEEITDFHMTEIDIMEASPFKWENFFDDTTTVCTAFDAWAVCIFVPRLGRWFAVGFAEGKGVKLLADAPDYLTALASADDFMREWGDTDKGAKSQSWINKQNTGKQTAALIKCGYEIGDILPMSRYRAACAMTWEWNKKRIKNVVLKFAELAA